jgi:hypothetical protein
MRFGFLGRGREYEEDVAKETQSTEGDFVEIGKLIGRLEEVANRFERAVDEVLPVIERQLEQENKDAGGPGTKRR